MKVGVIRLALFLAAVGLVCGLRAAIWAFQLVTGFMGLGGLPSLRGLPLRVEEEVGTLRRRVSRAILLAAVSRR